MVWAVWLSFATISAANIVTPGPANLNTLRRALQLGFLPVLPTIFGNALGLAVGGALCAWGVSAFVITSDILWAAFRWVGTGYLAWLGTKLIVRRERIARPGKLDCPVRAGALFREALLLAVTNPKALLFYAALFPQVLDPERALLQQSALLVFTYCALSVVSLSVYALMANHVRERCLTQGRYDVFQIVSGVVLLGFACMLALSGA
ncbi:Threonine/homoserine/homoserine lactone efflux protein [Nitratireductor aquibiodomus]|uniref:Threonine/homoserine/homoserine lactone efflux protein n=1 Tax=Nitratireductor aquibiodomus TaxID=204799 RepID=A0A1H4IJU8_9HYPH|nr:LysE family translocator [Nitratireductor aquibiodomus]SEB34361.1 Threonine/homoserine/homoserine lactone efflux protein [Nitratireductor aquibiodomus]